MPVADAAAGAPWKKPQLSSVLLRLRDVREQGASLPPARLTGRKIADPLCCGMLVVVTALVMR
jgi:hypothetical protein